MLNANAKRCVGVRSLQGYTVDLSVEGNDVWVEHVNDII